MDIDQYAQWFRNSTPYIQAHRGKTFVVLLPGEAIAHDEFTHIVHDLALLNVLGAQLVVVHGARPQIDAALTQPSQFHNGRRITPATDMQQVIGIYGQVRSRIEGVLATGLPNTPLHQTNINVVGGNFVVAKPMGVVNGIDHLFTGTPRKVHRERLKRLLAQNAIVLISPCGFSPSGESFNLAADELASAVAADLGAEKFIVFDELPYISGGADNTERISILNPTAAEDLAGILPATTRAHLSAMTQAVRGGVKRAHLLGFAVNGALLGELFTADGRGTQVTEEAATPVRVATIADIAAIIEIIRPLEAAGVLVKRSRDRLEQEIEQFFVAELDGIPIGCCALYPSSNIPTDEVTDGKPDKAAELACLAVHESYPGHQVGYSLLQHAQTEARRLGCARLFALTTQAVDWFVENGYQPGTLDDLPVTKQALYNYQRNSKVMIKTL